MAPPERFELPTYRFEADYFIQLSYDVVFRDPLDISKPVNQTWRIFISCG
jgi:hypothetical protein